ISNAITGAVSCAGRVSRVYCALCFIRTQEMEAFLVATGIVALAEIGDKTQLLAFILAAKYRKPVPIILGILLATIANHGFAGAVGAWVTTVLAPDTLRWILGISFLAMAGWTLIPDKFEEDEATLVS